MVELTPYAFWVGITFLIGYICITLEHFIKVNKATTAILMAVVSWFFLFLNPHCSNESNMNCLIGHLGSVSQIIFFLLGALAIVEVVSLHHGFKAISDLIHVGSKRKFLWVMGIITFFLSSVLDNLTTTIVMITLLSRLIPKSECRLIVGGGIVIAANAGGVWTPIGDVTTTMLWIGGQVSTTHLVEDLFLPSIVNLVLAFSVLGMALKGRFTPIESQEKQELKPFGRLIFFLGVGTMVFVPIFKLMTGLPQFMGILFGLSVLWVITDLLHGSIPERKSLKVPQALAQVDWSSTLFFLGILLSVDALDKANVLDQVAIWLNTNIGNTTLIASFLGFASAIVDNVPLVAASMGMYKLDLYPPDSSFWKLIAYCAGTGGSMLVIGSAAGVVFMGLEEVNFFWYFKKISFAALVGYIGGIGFYLLLS